jgi:NAD(P)H dehydrogenase (quinone)
VTPVTSSRFRPEVVSVARAGSGRYEDRVATPTYAVTGATGEIGRRVVARLADAGAAQRLVVRDPARAQPPTGASVAQAEYRDGDAMVRACEGVSTLFLVSAAETEDRVSEHLSAVDAAVAAGVERIVYLSFVNAAADATFTLARHHWATEERIRASGVAYTFLRDNLYADFVPYFTSPDDLAIRGPADGGRMGAVARDDIGEVAATVLLEGSTHDGRTYDVTGPEAITLAEAAATLSRALGRTVRFVDETVEEAYASRATYGAPAWMVDGWVSTYLAIADGSVETVSDTVERLTGHPAASLGELLERRPELLDRLR